MLKNSHSAVDSFNVFPRDKISNETSYSFDLCRVVPHEIFFVALKDSAVAWQSDWRKLSPPQSVEAILASDLWTEESLNLS
jgi:hypothetical protein